MSERVELVKIGCLIASAAAGVYTRGETGVAPRTPTGADRPIPAQAPNPPPFPGVRFRVRPADRTAPETVVDDPADRPGDGMSDRHAAAVTVPRPAGPPARSPAAALPGPTAGPIPWDRFFLSLPPDAQTALLRRAADHGAVAACDLPKLPPAAGPHDRADRFLARVFADAPLPPFDPAPLANPDRPPAEFQIGRAHV